MTVAVPQHWTALGANADIEITTVPTPMNWLVAVVTWRAVDGSAPTISLGDFSRNIWQLPYNATMHAWVLNAAAQIYAQVWVCPAARYDGWAYLNAYVSASAISASDVGTVAVNVFELSGMGNGWLTVDSVTRNTAAAATTLSLAVPTPAADCVMVAVAATDNATGTVSNTGTLTALTQVVGAAPAVTCTAAWKEATTSQTASWSSTVACNWAGVVIAFRQTGVLPSQPSPNWPITKWYLGLGYGGTTPTSYVTWTDQTTRLINTPLQSSLSSTRGVPYDQQEANSEQGTLLIRNDDGAFSPRTPGSATANGAGSTTTILIPDAQNTNINVADFFQLYTSGGALKEFAVFQVVSVATPGTGTTTVKFTRTDGGGAAQAATASGDVYTGIGLDVDIPWMFCFYWAGKLYPVMSGWLYDYTLTWDDAHWGWVQATISDALAPLAATQNLSVVRKEILRRNPYCYWPLDDASGSLGAANASGNSLAQLVSTTSKFGAGTSGNESADFGASTQDVPVDSGSSLTRTLVGDAATGWAQGGLTSADLIADEGYALVATDAGMPPISGGVTILGSTFVASDDFTNVINPSGKNPTVFIIRNANPAAGNSGGSILKLSFNFTLNQWVVTVWDKATRATTVTTTTFSMLVNFATFALTFNQTSWALYYGGSLISSGSCNLSATFSSINVGGEADQYFNGNAYPGIHAHYAIFGRRLTAGECAVLDHAYEQGQAGITPSAPESTAYRIQRSLTATDVVTPRVLTGSVVGCSVEDASDNSVGSLAIHVAEYEDGQWFTDALGQLRFTSAGASYHQTSKATFGENTGAGEIPYEKGQQFALDRKLLFTQVVVNNSAETHLLSPLSTVTFTATSDSAQSKYRPSTMPRNTFLNDLGDVFGIAWWLLGRFSTTQKYVPTIQIDAAKDSSRWTTVLGLEVGDIVTVNRRPLANTPAISVRCRILQITPDVGSFRALWTLVVAPAPGPVCILGDSTYGVVGSNVVGA